MTEPWGRLRVDVVDDEIIVSLPGTSYSVTYCKRARSPQLHARNISHTDDRRTPVKLFDFLARAWQGRRVSVGGSCEGSGFPNASIRRNVLTIAPRATSGSLLPVNAAT